MYLKIKKNSGLPDLKKLNEVINLKIKRKRQFEIEEEEIHNSLSNTDIKQAEITNN